MIPLAIATCRPLPEPDPDEELLLDALREAGIDARMTPWREDRDGTVATPTVIRSTWDYVRHHDEFRSWVDAAERRAPLWNPARVVRANLHKRYLLDLQRRGVPVTPTELVDRGDARSLAEVAADRGWRDVVIKPAVGAGSFETHRGRASDPGLQVRFARLVAACDVLVPCSRNPERWTAWWQASSAGCGPESGSGPGRQRFSFNERTEYNGARPAAGCSSSPRTCPRRDERDAS